MDCWFLNNTLLQRGVASRTYGQNRFNGFQQTSETVETVIPFRTSNFTPLKQGVNEKLQIEPKTCVAQTS